MRAATIQRITGTPPPSISELVRAADTEGFRNMARLVADWESGTERFDAPGAVLFGAVLDSRLVGVGGATREPTAPASPLLRVRRFYVLPDARGRAVGAALADAVVAHARGHADRLLVNSNPPAMEFWDRAGFARSDRDGVTHELRF